MKYLVFIVVSSLMLSLPARAVDLPIGSITLSLGMEQTQVMQELKRRFHIVPAGQDGTVLVAERQGQLLNYVGGVAFKNGRLTWIQRNWGTFSGKVNSVEVSKSFFSAIESATASSGAAVVTTTKVQRIPGTEFKSVYFSFSDGRKITISTTDGDAKWGQQVSIEETVSEKQ